METIDQALQQRVWERVRGTAQPREPEPESLRELIAGEWADSAAYLRLAEHYRGGEAALLRQMHRREQAHLASLKGIYRVLTGRPATVKSPPLPREGKETALRRCYYREQRCMESYRQWMAHPVFGPVFENMYAQELAHSGVLLELIGRLPAANIVAK